MKLLPRLLLMLLTLAFAAGSVGLAQARVQAGAAGEIVICSGSAMVTLAVGPDGQPVLATHLCPDCVPAMVAADPLAAQPPAVPALRLLAVLRAGAGWPGVALAAPNPAARGPPALI